jgi:hypothetical protein
MRLAATQVQFACDWRQLGNNLHAAGGHSGTIYVQLATNIPSQPNLALNARKKSNIFLERRSIRKSCRVP